MSDVKNAYLEQLFQGNKPSSIEESVRLKREAYDKAHDIRKFEIQMYWTRSAYLWALQAASLAGLAAILAATDEIDVRCKEDDCTALVRLLVLIAIWCFGLFSAFIWVMLLRGAKFWQEIWERHVDYLEDEFSGSLYKTYVSDRTMEPYSVTKINLAMAIFSFFVWIFICSAAFIVLFPEFSILLLFFYVLIFLSLFLIDADLKMKKFKKEVKVIKKNEAEIYITSRKL